MPLSSPTGAPLVDVENDSPRDDLPEMLADLADWADEGSVRSFATAGARNAAISGLTSQERRLAFVGGSTNALTVWTGTSWTTLAQAGGTSWTTFSPTIKNWNSSTGEVSDLNPGGFSYSGAYKLLDAKTAAWRFTVNFGNPGGLGDNIFLFSIPLNFRNTQMGSAKIVHDGSTYGVTCQTNGNRDGLGMVSLIRGDATGGGFYHRGTWGTGNDWKNGDVVVASGTWELS